MEFARRVTGLVVVLGILLPTMVWGQRVVTLSPAKNYLPYDVSVAINPRNLNDIKVMAKRQKFNVEGISSHLFNSSDGGITWSESNLSQDDVNGFGSGTIGFDSDGAPVRCYLPLSQDGRSRETHLAKNIFIRKSSVNGEKWGAPVTVVDGDGVGAWFESSPWFSIDRMESSSHLENVYVSWTRFEQLPAEGAAGKSHVMFSRSVNGGSVFLPAVQVSDQGGDCQGGDNSLRGSIPATSLRGEIYLVWAGPRGLEFDSSTDGGNSWGKDRVIAKTPGGWKSNVAGLKRHHGFPVTCVDQSTSVFKDSIYVCWVDERNVDKDVFLMASRDRGKTWTRVLRVNNDAERNGADQFLCWMAVDPVDGSVNIVFYDRSGLQDGQTGLTLARSVDGGRSFDQYRIDIRPFKCNRSVFLGDHIGIDAKGGRVVLAFPHFVEHDRLVLSAAMFDFLPGKNTLIR